MYPWQLYFYHFSYVGKFRSLRGRPRGTTWAFAHLVNLLDEGLGQRLSLYRSKTVKIVVFCENRFCEEYFSREIESAMVPSSFSCRDALNDILFDLERPRSKFDLRSMSRGHPNRSFCMSPDAPQREKCNEINPTSVYLFSTKRY